MKTFALILFLSILGSCEYAPAQSPTPTPCDHSSNQKERFESIRLTPPVKILDWDGRTLNVKYEDRLRVEYITFTADKDSIIHLPTDYKHGLFWVIFCLKDYYVYTVAELTPTQMRKKP